METKKANNGSNVPATTFDYAALMEVIKQDSASSGDQIERATKEKLAVTWDNITATTESTHYGALQSKLAGGRITSKAQQVRDFLAGHLDALKEGRYYEVRNAFKEFTDQTELFKSNAQVDANFFGHTRRIQAANGLDIVGISTLRNLVAKQKESAQAAVNC